jgi:hypothetical protein
MSKNMIQNETPTEKTWTKAWGWKCDVHMPKLYKKLLLICVLVFISNEKIWAQSGSAELGSAPVAPNDNRTVIQPREKLFLSDLNKICNAYKITAKESKTRQYSDKPSELHRKLHGRIEIAIKSKTMKKAWSDFKTISPNDAENYFQQIAEDQGIKTWSCPEIGNFYKWFRE